ncbi:PKD domain-containing protein [Halomicroarcula sp. F28]|uniref:PKD domain-containing protein n=1 Tax=Haloarcula salinisoli TaxID=2487746 RepID=UPI001C73A16E|nr:PKD domain-containing protein [Halomicroarcula salinisoli]MBX0287616.1 PKD domain-containing protein [Halomicroarcula salinisoli]
MTAQGTPDQDSEKEDREGDRHAHSRRALLASIGAGVAGATLGGLTETASASGEDSSAGEFIESTSPATTATADGSWSDGAVWDNGVPAAGQTVRIDSGVTLTVDGTTEKIKNLDVAGTLTFATDTDSHLRAETIVTRPDSTMHIGTESDPISPDSEARITIVHHEDISEKDDPERISKGLITMGELEIHGAEKTSWDELASAPTAGDTTIELASAPTNWNEGDEIVIPGLDPSSNEDDERTIASVSGATVELDEPLEYDHVPPENNLDVELTAYALNRTRNVRFESEIKETDVTNEARINRQGHFMVMQPAQSISYLEVDHFGRTNKNFWMDEQDYSGDRVHGHGTEEPSEPNIVARYGLHFHQTGIGEDPHEVTGVVVQHSPGWGVVNHSSHANVRDSITYDVFGSGFVAEAGKERGSFERCFALRSEGSRNVKETYNDLNLMGRAPTEEVDFGHEGEGFWLQGPAVAVDDCVAAGHDGYAFALWNEPLDGKMPGELAKEDGLVDTAYTISPRFLPLKSFSNNTAFAASGGFDYGFSRPRSESVVETFTVYNIGPRINTSTWHYPAGAPYFMGSYGNCMIANRYGSDLRVENPQFCNVDGESGHGPDGYHGHGIRRNYQAEDPVGVYGGVMEGLNVGVQVCLNANEEDVDDVSFYNNQHNIVFENRTVLRSLVDYGADYVADLTVHPGTKVDFWWSSADVKSQPEAAAWDGNSATHRVSGEYEFRWMDTPAMMTVTEEPPEGQGPVAAFDHQSTDTASEPVTFDASPSTPSDSITSYEWAFGDGTTGSGKTVEHSYDTSGFYDVTLTVTDDAGNTGETTTEVAAGETHEILINGLDDKGSEYELSVSGTLEKGEYASGQDTVEGSTATGEIGGGQDNYHYTGEITRWSLEKDVPLEITIDGEEVDQSTLGNLGFATTNESGTTVSFDASGSSLTDGSITSYEWAFGDGATASGETVEHTFDEAGYYDVTLTVTDDAGDTIETTKEVTVGEPHEIVINGLDDQHADYELSVSGEIKKGEDASVIDSIEEDTVSAEIGGEQDNYHYDGEITSWSLDKDIPIKITIDGEEVDPSTLGDGSTERHEIVIDGLDDQVSDYEFSVSGAVEKGEHAGGPDDVEGNTVSGQIVAGKDSYLYEGEITSWSLEKDIPVKVTIDGEEVDPSTLGNSDDGGDSDADKTVTVAPDGNHEFSPADLTVEPGTTVTFTWDAGGHTVTVDSQPDDASWSGVDSTQSEGHTLTHTFDVEGTYEYHCQPHQSHMQGTITVEGSQSVSEAFDEDDDGKMDDSEILDAVEYWQDEEPVPGIGGEIIDDQKILDLVESWQGGGDE